MNPEITVKRITKRHASCECCGLPLINCICEVSEKTDTGIKFWILSSRREFYRPSNTARLMKLINPQSTEVFMWERTRAPEALLEKIQSKEYDVYILFPAETDELRQREVEFRMNAGKTVFIILDGTWSEARRILRKSEYLNALPIVSIRSAEKSEFDLRKGAGQGEICTIEAAIAILKLNGEAEQVKAFQRGFHLFVKAYKASVCGHETKL